LLLFLQKKKFFLRALYSIWTAVMVAKAALG